MAASPGVPIYTVEYCSNRFKPKINALVGARADGQVDTPAYDLVKTLFERLTLLRTWGGLKDPPSTRSAITPKRLLRSLRNFLAFIVGQLRFF